MMLGNGIRVAVAFLSTTLVMPLAFAACQPATETPTSASVAIRCDSVAKGGNAFVVGIVFSDTTMPTAGFNLNIEYDRGALVFDSAALGSLTSGEWEYFVSRSGLVDPSDTGGIAGFVRLVALADQPDTLNRKPKPRSLVGPGELARIYFYVSERKDYLGRSTSLRFIWTKCDDNSFSDPKGIKLFVSHDVYDAAGERPGEGIEKYTGIAARCFSSRRNPPQRVIDFHNAVVTVR